MMTEAGFRQGAYSACLFYHGEESSSCTVRSTWAEQELGLISRSRSTAREGEVQGYVGAGQSGSGEDLEQDRDGDGPGAGARGGPEARGDLDEGRGHRRGGAKASRLRERVQAKGGKLKKQKSVEKVS